MLMEIINSIIDPEAHSMLDKNGEWGFNYNFQAGGMINMEWLLYITLHKVQMIKKNY